MYSKLLNEPVLKAIRPEKMASAMLPDSFAYEGACLSSSSDEESASLQTVLVLDFPTHHGGLDCQTARFCVSGFRPEFRKDQ